MAYKATIGTISHGTLRTVDLVDAFASELEALARGPSITANEALLVRESQQWLELEEDNRDEEEGSEIVNALMDALNEHAPPYCYFGANEGDGSDFGFWPSMAAIEELPHVPDDTEDESFAAAARRLGEDCKYVNDHGNVTVYGADGSILIELV
jgi:hypothetical protein